MIARTTQLVLVLHFLVVLRRHIFTALFVSICCSRTRPEQRWRRGGCVQVEKIHPIHHVRWSHGAWEGRCWQSSVTIGIKWRIGSRESRWRGRRWRRIEESRWTQQRVNHGWRICGCCVEAAAVGVIASGWRRGRGCYGGDRRAIIEWLWGRWSGGRSELSPQSTCVSHRGQIGPGEAAARKQHVSD